MLAVAAAAAASAAAASAAAASAAAASTAAASTAAASTAAASGAAASTAAGTAASTTAGTTAASTASTTSATTGTTATAGTPTTTTTPTAESLDTANKGLQATEQGGATKPPTHEVQLQDGSQVEARTANNISDERAIELRKNPNVEKIQSQTIQGQDEFGFPTETQEHLYRVTDASGNQNYITSNTDVYAKTALEQQQDLMKLQIIAQVVPQLLDR